MEDHDVFDISLHCDSPVFIDPFLLFNGKSKTLRKVHQKILDYFVFLKNITNSHGKSNYIINEFFLFQEVRELWLGYCEYGNMGSGPGAKFASKLFDNLKELDTFTPDGSKIVESEHIEKLALLDPRIGKDCISDLTATLIKPYLLKYTQSFSREYVDKNQCSDFAVSRATFREESGSSNIGQWVNKKYFLPRHPFKPNEYIILTPKSILAKSDYWINRADMVTNFDDIVQSIDDAHLRSKFNFYITQALRKKQQELNLKSKKPRKAILNKKEKREAVDRLIKGHPDFIDYFIRYKENNGQAAHIKASTELETLLKEWPEVPKNQFSRFLQDFFKENDLTKSKVSYEEALKSVIHMKNCIENKGAHKIFYNKQNQLSCDEAFFQNIFKFVVHSLKSDVNAEVNNGRGPADFIFSNGPDDKTIVEFKLASNSALKANLKNQVDIYKAASDAQHHIHVIFVFSVGEQKRVELICDNIGISLTSKNLVIIDARLDNKPTGSKAR